LWLIQFNIINFQKDYKRSQIKGASYPAITPCEGAQVQGLLIQVISQRGEQTLDDFETDVLFLFISYYFLFSINIDLIIYLGLSKNFSNSESC